MTEVINDVAERAVLGALLLGAADDDMQALVDAEMFARPAHRIVFDSIEKVRRDHGRVDELLVLADLIQRGEINRMGGGTFLHGLVEGCNPASGTFFARQVAESHQRRELLTLAAGLSQRAASPAVDILETIAEARERLECADLLAGAARASASGVVDGFEWLESPVPRKPFLVPGLLRVSDRVIVTGTSGAGKSTLLRQIVGLVCTGLHPFTRAQIEPKRVLVFDCENDEDENWSFFNKLFRLTDQDGGERRTGFFTVRHKPGGMNLAAAPHARLLLDAINESRADIVLVGPLYKLSAGNTNDEENARKVTWILDTIRERTGVAMLIEAHPGHKEITVKDASGQGHQRVDPRPRGSSLLLNWPEVGIGLQAGLDDFDGPEHRFSLVDWRGMRGARAWPTSVEAGRRYPWDACEWGSWGRHWSDEKPDQRYEKAS